MESSSFLNESTASLHPPETIMIQIQDNPSADPDSPLSTPPQSPLRTTTTTLTTSGSNTLSDTSSPAPQAAALPSYTMVRQNNSELEGRTSRKSRLRAQARSLFDEQKEDEIEEDDEEDELVPQYPKTTLSPRLYATTNEITLDEQLALGSGSYTPSVSFTSEGVEIGPMMIPSSSRSLAPSLDENGSLAAHKSVADNVSMAPSIDEAGSGRDKKKERAVVREDVRDVPTTHRSIESVRVTPPEAAVAATAAVAAAPAPSQDGPLDEVIQDQQLGPELPPPTEETGPRRIKPKSPMERLRQRARSTGRTRVAHLALDLNRRPKTALKAATGAAFRPSEPVSSKGVATTANGGKAEETVPMLPSLGTMPVASPSKTDKSTSPSVSSPTGTDPSHAIDLTNMFSKSPQQPQNERSVQRSSPSTMEDPPSLSSSPKQSSTSRSSSKSPHQSKKKSTRSSSASPASSSSPTTKRTSETRSKLTLPRKTRPMRSHKKSYPTLMDDTGLSSSDETPLMTNALYSRAKPSLRRQDRRTRQQTQLKSMYGKAVKRKHGDDAGARSNGGVSPTSPVVEERSALVDSATGSKEEASEPAVDPTALALPPLVVDQQQIQSIGVKALMSVCDGIGSLFLTQKPGEATRATQSPPKDSNRKTAVVAEEESPRQRGSRSLSPVNNSSSRRRRRLLERAKTAHKAEADRLYPPTSPNNPLYAPVQTKREEFPMDEVSELGKDIVNALHLASSADMSEKSLPVSIAEEDSPPTQGESSVEITSKLGSTGKKASMNGGRKNDLKDSTSAISADSLETTLANLEKAAEAERLSKLAVAAPPSEASRGIVNILNAQTDAPVSHDAVVEVDPPEPNKAVATTSVAWESGVVPTTETPRQVLETTEDDDSSTGSGWSLARAIKKQAKQAAAKKEIRKSRAKDSKSKEAPETTKSIARSEPDGSKDVVDYEAAAFPFGNGPTTAGSVEERQAEISEPPTLLRMNTSLEESFGNDFAPAAVETSPQPAVSDEDDLLDVEKTESHLSPMSEFLAERVHNAQAKKNVFEEPTPVESDILQDSAAELSVATDFEPRSDVPAAEDDHDEFEIVSKPLKVDMNDRALEVDCLATTNDIEPKISTSNTLLTEDTSPMSNVDDMTPSSDAFSQFEYETKEIPATLSDNGKTEVATPDTVSRSVLTDEATPQHDVQPPEKQAVNAINDAGALESSSTAAAFLRIAERMKNRSLGSKQTLGADESEATELSRSLPVPSAVSEPKTATLPNTATENDAFQTEIIEAPSEELLESKPEELSASEQEEAVCVPTVDLDTQPFLEGKFTDRDFVPVETFETCPETAEMPADETDSACDVPFEMNAPGFSEKTKAQPDQYGLDDDDCSSTDDLLNNLDTMVRDLDGMASSRRNEAIANDDYSVATAPSFTDAVKTEHSSSSSRDVESEMVIESDDTRVGLGFAGMPFMISEINNEAGIPKGDIMVSLLNTDGVASQTWSSRVSEAIWRCRMMRRHCDLEWMELFATRKKGRRKMKASLLVDVDEGRVFGGLEELPKIHEAATENLCNDEFDDALDLYEDALMIYENYGDEIKDDEAKSQKFKQYEIACLNNVGMVHLLRGEYEEALPYFQNACESIAAFSEPDQATVMTKTAICRFALGDYATAYSELEETLLVAREEASTLSAFRELAEILNNLGCLSYLGGKLERGLLYFQNALEIHELVSTRSMYAGSKFACQTAALNMSVTKANIGFLSLVTRDIPQSILLFEAAARDQELLLRGAHTTLISTMEHLVVANLLDGRKVRALQLLQRILSMQEAEFGVGSEECFTTKNKIVLLQRNENPSEDPLSS